MWVSRLIHLWGPLSHCCEEKMESVDQFEKIQEWLSESTVSKKFKIIMECPRSLRLLLPSTQKRSIARNYWNPTWLAGTGLPTSRDEHGSGLDRTGSGLKPILAGSGLDWTAIFLKTGGAGLDRTEKIFFVSMLLFWTYQKFWLWSNFTDLLNGHEILPWMTKALLRLFCHLNCVHFRDDHYPVYWLYIRQDIEFATGYGYPETTFKREPDTDPDIGNAFVDILRIQTFGKSCTLRNYSFILVSSEPSCLLCHDYETVYDVISVP